MAASASAAVSKQGLVIPLIDFSRFCDGSPAERAAAAQAMLHGFQTAGFVYLAQHGVADEAVRRALARSADFFAQPLAAKQALGWTTADANRGYSSPGREKVSQQLDARAVERERGAAPDLKESFEMGRDNDPARPNPWPADEGTLAGFRADMMALFDACQALHVAVMRALALAMGLGETFFDARIDAADNTLRLLHYPAVGAGVFRANPGQVRAGEHTDYGSVTLLFQDSQGGLQVRSPTGHFVDATPIEGTVVVNAGDLLARWSNDSVKSTLHRVVEPPRRGGNGDGDGDGDEHPPRYSIAYFCNPNADCFIETLPGRYATEQDKKYEGVYSGEYLVRRLEATH